MPGSHGNSSSDVADLHMHSSHSDGRRETAELVDMAVAAGLRAVALTDHDTVAGVEEMTRQGREAGLEVVPGVELSTHHEGCDLHLLGYCMDLGDEDLLASLDRFREERLKRGKRIVDRLHEIDVPVSWAAVEAAADGGAVGRPHIARALAEEGFVEDAEAAFQEYLRPGRPGYIEKYTFATSEAIRLVQATGGVAVLAHPGTIGKPEIVEELAAAGIDGLEVDHPRNSPEDKERLRAIAERHDLVQTGGSDFHGDEQRPGEAPLGSSRVAYAVVEELRRRAESHRAERSGF